MRKLLALAAVILGISVSAPASAQSLNGILGLLNGGRSVSNTIGSGCSSGGINQIACQAQRLNSVSQQFRSQQQQMQNRQRQEMQRQQRINSALVRACKMGDQYSCERAGPAIDPRATQLQQALAEACNAGDRISCQRADEVHSEMYSQQTYARR